MLQAMRPDRMRHLRALEKVQWESADRIGQRNHELAGAILRHACRTVPFYRDFSTQTGLAVEKLTGEDLARFPILKKTTIIADRENFLNQDAPPDRMIPNLTGGSSGVLFHFFNDRNTIDLRTANDLRARSWAGWSPGEAQAVLWGHPRDNKTTYSRRGRFLAQYVHRSLTLNTFNLNQEDVARFHRQLAGFQPSLILGYASALDFLATFLKSRSLSLESPTGLISSAETLTPEHRANIESAFSCPLLNRYGSREFGVVAQQCEARNGLHVFSDQVQVEILTPDGDPCPPGELGEIVITDLANFVMPLIRYRTGDMARSMAEPCTCGRGFPLLKGVEGRTSELIVGKNGKFYSCPGPRFYSAGIAGIHQMQLIQETIDEIQVKIVPGADWSSKSAEQITNRMRELLGDVEVRVLIVDDIPPAPSGKFPFAISKISPFSQ